MIRKLDLANGGYHIELEQKDIALLEERQIFQSSLDFKDGSIEESHIITISLCTLEQLSQIKDVIVKDPSRGQLHQTSSCVLVAQKGNHHMVYYQNEEGERFLDSFHKEEGGLIKENKYDEKENGILLFIRS
jgi:hypothetical protein